VRIGRFFPGFRAPPADAALPQELPQMFQADGANDPLFDEVLAQLGQRPLGQADELAGRREGHLDDLFDDLGQEDSGLASVVRVEGVPGDAVDPLGVEAPEDDSHPLRRAVTEAGDLGVAAAAGRKQDDAGVTAIDLVGQLAFHSVELLAFIRPERPCSHAVHCGSPRGGMCCSKYTRRPYILWITCGRKCLTCRQLQNAKLINWKRH